RWPCEELQFRGMKSFACLNRVAGYGKKKLVDEKMRAAQKKLEGQIDSVRGELKVPPKEIAAQEERLAYLIKRRRRIRRQGRIVQGERRLPARAEQDLNRLSRSIGAIDRQIKALQAPHGKRFKKL